MNEPVKQIDEKNNYCENGVVLWKGDGSQGGLVWVSSREVKQSVSCFQMTTSSQEAAVLVQEKGGRGLDSGGLRDGKLYQFFVHIIDLLPLPTSSLHHHILFLICKDITRD